MGRGSVHEKTGRRAGSGQGKELAIVEEQQVKAMRTEFEKISAPKVSVTLTQLTKFQARLIRRSMAVCKKQQPVLPVPALVQAMTQRGAWDKMSEKEIREIAKKTAIKVFVETGHMDTSTWEPLEGATVTFEDFLAVTMGVKLHVQNTTYTPTNARMSRSERCLLDR
jgi:hypothetical protein